MSSRTSLGWSSRVRSFLRLSWMGRLPFAGWGASWREWLGEGPSPKKDKKPSFRPQLWPLERRETPNDPLNFIAAPMGLGGLTLLAGSFRTPIQVFANGWGESAAPPAPTAGRTSQPFSLIEPFALPPAGHTNPVVPPLPGPPSESSQNPVVPPPPPEEEGKAELQAAPHADPYDPVPSTWLELVGDFLGTGTRQPRPLQGPGPYDGPIAAGPAPSASSGGGDSAGSLPQAGGGGGGKSADDDLASLAGLAGFGGEDPAGGGGGDSGAGRQVQARLAKDFGRTPLPFERNVGQTSSQVIFLSRGPGFGLFLGSDSATFALPRTDDQGERVRDVLKMHFEEGSARTRILAREPLASRSNYFTGNDPEGWHVNVPHFGSIEYREIYPGITLSFHGHTPQDRLLEFDYTLAPGADVSDVVFRWEGTDDISVDPQGRLLLSVGGREVVQEAPVVYHKGADGSRDYLPGSYRMLGGGRVGFTVTGRDPARELVIDPVIGFSSYLGGSGNDYAYGIAVDGAGNSYVSGKTASTDFPTTPGGGQSAGGGDAFVAKFNAAGDQLVYSAYLGGGAADQANAVAVDLKGNAYLGGTTTSSDFPTTSAAYQSARSGAGDAFVAKLSAAGDGLLYASYFGGSSGESGQAIAVDEHGQFFLTGNTSSTDLPTTSGVFQTASGDFLFGFGDSFVVKFTAAGGLSYSSYLGGDGTEFARGLALGGDGSAYVVGDTDAFDFPTTGGAFQTTFNGVYDGFVSKVSPDGTTLTYSSYLGGEDIDVPYAVAVDGSGRAHVVGETSSSLNFPTTSGAYQTSLKGGSDAFVSKVSADGSTLSYSTYLGGAGGDGARGVALDPEGRATLVGGTASTDFPTTAGAPQGTHGGTATYPYDAFVTRLTTTGTLSYSTFLGGSGDDEARAVAVDLRGAAYVAGYTNSTDFPTADPYQGTLNTGTYDAFVAKLLPLEAPKITAVSSDTGASSSDAITTDQTLTISGTSEALATVTLYRAGVGEVGSVAANGGGAWSYDYTGTTLDEGTYAFWAEASLGGHTSDFSDTFLVDVDRSGPDVTLDAPATTPSRGPQVRVTARDRGGIADGATVTLDADLNNDNDFLDANESGYATTTLDDGYALLTVPTLSTTGTYHFRARVTDLAGNEGTSATATLQVTSVTGAWTATAEAPESDPLTGDRLRQLGSLQVGHALDLDDSPGSGQGGSPALVYTSDSVSVKPIIRVTVPSDNASSLPATLTAQLTFNGTTETAQNFSTTGFSPGDVFTLALQTSSAVSTTGRYHYSVLVQISGQSDQTVAGPAFVVAQDNSALGAGWSLSTVDRLVDISADATNGYPAGQLRLFGTGGWRFYEDTGGGTFDSPAGDAGTLSKSGNTFTYETPGEQQWTFDSSGYQTQWESPDGNHTLTYAYDGSNNLTGITAIDGSRATLTYSSGKLSTIAASQGTTTLTHTGSDLTTIEDPAGGLHTFTYNGSDLLTREQYGELENNWAYASDNTLSTITWGATSFGGESNPSVSTLNPALTQGLSALVAGTVWTKATDPLGHSTRQELDSKGRTLKAMAGDGNLWQYTRDSEGRVTKETDALGNVTSYVRDSKGYVTSVTLPDGNTRSFEYQSAFHALTTMVDERTHTSTYDYDACGCLTSETDPLGNTASYTYNADKLLETVEDPLGNTASYEYDSRNRRTVVEDPLGQVTSTTYGSTGEVETVEDPLGRVTTSVHDALGRATGTVNALGDRTTLTLDPSGLGLTSTDQLGRKAETGYDVFKRGLPEQRYRAKDSDDQTSGLTQYDDAGKGTGSRDGLAFWNTQTLDAAGRVVSSQDPLGNKTRTYYDELGRPVETRDALGAWSQQEYNSRGWVTKSTDALGNVTTYLYDEAGNRTGTIDPLGNRTTTSYDALNRAAVVEDAEGDKTTTTYDAAGRVSSVKDAEGNTTSFTYDALGRQLTRTEAVGTSVERTFTFSYDAVGNTKTEEDGLGNVTSYLYDALNRNTEVTDPLGEKVTTAYDKVGNATSRKDPLGKVHTYTYDALNRQVTSEDPLGQLATSILDAKGQAAGSLDGLAKLDRDVFDAAGRHIVEVDALGGLTRRAYDAGGNLLRLTDPVGNQWDYVYDANGREIRRTDPDAKSVTTSYDGAGRVSEVEDRLGRTITYAYDGVGRLTGQTWKDSSDTTVNTLTYTYDAVGNRLTAQDSVGTLTYTYDELNRTKTATDVYGLVLTYSYDEADRLTGVADSKSGVLTHAYDARGQRTQTESAGGSQTTVRVDFAYTDRGELDTISRYSDLAGTTSKGTTDYDYDDAGRVTQIHSQDSSSATLSLYSYEYDDADRVTTHTWESTTTTGTLNGTYTYEYDATDQLTDDSQTQYSYDSNGNRTLSGYQTGTGNRLENDGTWTYTYDAEGNQVTKSKGPSLEKWYYEYDHRNLLTAVRKTSDGSTDVLRVTYTYDVEGRRVKRQEWESGVGPTEERYAYNGEHVWADLDNTNAVTARYLYREGTDQIESRWVASGANSGRAFYLTDIVGSVRDLVDWSENLQDHINYDSFGIATHTNGSYPDRYLFTGREYDGKTGLQYNRARYYDSATGRWLSEDPIGFAAGDANLYRYLSNGPANATDPYGLQERREPAWSNVFNTVHQSELEYRWFFGIYETWKHEWMDTCEKNPKKKWYEVPNPPGAEHYPPGFCCGLDLDVLVLFEQNTIRTDGYWWIHNKHQDPNRISNYGDLVKALKMRPANSLDMILLSGHTPNKATKHCGMRFGKGNELVDPIEGNVDERMPDDVLALIKSRLRPDGILVFTSCDGGTNKRALVQLAGRLDRGVCGATGAGGFGPGRKPGDSYGLASWNPHIGIAIWSNDIEDIVNVTLNIEKSFGGWCPYGYNKSWE